MSFVETLRLVLDADMHGGIKEVENLGTTAKREGAKAEASLDRVGSSMTRVGAVMVAGGAAALFGLGKAAQASEEAHASVVKLQNSLSNNPRLAGASAESFIDLADAIQDKTAADGDSIVAGEAVLAQGKLTAAQIQELTPLVVDLARKKGIDEVTAFTMAAKAADGNVGALKRSGIAVDETLAKTDAYGATVEALRGSVGGFAEEEGKTFSGSLERLKNQMGDVAEGVGVGAVDAFSDLFGVIQPVVDGFNDMDPAAQSLIGKVATFGSVALIAAGGASVLIGQAIKMRQNFSDAWGAVSGLADRLGGFRSAAILGASSIAVLVTGFMLWQDQQSKARAEQERLRESLRETKGEIEGVTKTLVINAFRPWIDDLNDAGVSLKTLTEALDGNEDAIHKVTAASFEMGGANGEGLRRQLDNGTDAIKAQRTALGEEAEFATKAGDAASTAAGGARELGEGLDEGATAAAAAKTALQELTDQLRGTVDPFFAAEDAVFGLQEAQRNWTDAQLDVVAAQQAVTDAVAEFGANSPEAVEAYAKVAQANLDVDSAQRTAERSTIDLQVAAEGLRSTVEQNPAALIQAKDEMYRLAVAAGFSHDQAMAMAAGLSTATAAVDAHGRALDAIDGKIAKTEVLTLFTSRDSSGQAVRRFHEGGIVPGRRGQEVAGLLLGQEEVLAFDDPRHSANIARTFSDAALSGGGGSGGFSPGSPNIHIHVELDKERLIRVLQLETANHGGNVQATFGRR